MRKSAVVLFALSLFIMGFTVAQATDAPVTIRACIQGKVLQVPSERADGTFYCPSGTAPITWNNVGPEGPQGPAGAPGLPGEDGAQSVIPGPEGPEGDKGVGVSINEADTATEECVEFAYDDAPNTTVADVCVPAAPVAPPPAPTFECVGTNVRNTGGSVSNFLMDVTCYNIPSNAFQIVIRDSRNPGLILDTIPGGEQQRIVFVENAPPGSGTYNFTATSSTGEADGFSVVR